MRESSSGSSAVSILALFAYTGFRVIPLANRIMRNVGFLREAHPWVVSMADDMRTLRAPEVTPFSPQPPLMLEAIACDEVSFRYDEEGSLALDRISLTIRRGDSVGIVGATGAGKSTLVDVLLGLLSPTSGRVLIDGVPLDASPSRARRTTIHQSCFSTRRLQRSTARPSARSPRQLPPCGAPGRSLPWPIGLVSSSDQPRSVRVSTSCVPARACSIHAPTALPPPGGASVR